MARHTEDQNGYITIPNNPISRSGVFEYLGSEISPELEPDRIYRVWRPESELNNPATIESFKLSPWIPYHEMLGTGFSAPEQVGIQGVTGEDVHYTNGTLFSNLRIYGESLKQAIKNGLKELSCGFRCLWDITAGVTPEGEHYDVVQREIRGNHLASVEEGRMGQQVAVAMDRATFALDGLTIKTGDIMTLEELLEAIAQLSADDTAKLLATLQDKSGDAEDEEKAEDEGKAEDAESEDKAEDADAEDEEAAADEDTKAEDEADSAMDAKIKALSAKIKRLESNAMDSASIMRDVNKRNQLANKASAIVGAFDCESMTEKQVAAYSLKKMGVACDSGEEVATLKGVLAAYSKPQTTVDNGSAMDSKSTAQADDALTKMGIA